MDLFEQIENVLSAPWATEEEDLAYRINVARVSNGGGASIKKEIEKKPPSIGLSHALFKTGKLYPEARIISAHLNGRMSLAKRVILLQACKQSEQNDSSKIENMATAMGVRNTGLIESAFLVQGEFAKAGEGWDPILWLEY
jgi:hypothetical protein